MIKHRQYQHTKNLFEGDFLLVRDFLIKLNNPIYSVGWWDCKITGSSDTEYLNKFGLWFEDNQLIAVAWTEDSSLGTGLLCVNDDKHFLISEMVDYAKNHLHDNGSLSLLVPDLDKGYQEAVAQAGFVLTQERDTESIITIGQNNLNYSLPEGFHITSMADNYNAVQYERIMRRGFSEDRDERILSPAEISDIDRKFKRPFINLGLQVAVAAPDGSFAAFCGIWHTKESKMVCIEPVVTDPDYLKRGLGKVAVYEALNRCAKLGATSAVVYSSIQFYFSIGFRPNSTSTWWKMNGGIE